MITIKEIIQIEIIQQTSHTARINKLESILKETVVNSQEYIMTKYNSQGNHCVAQFTKR